MSNETVSIVPLTKPEMEALESSVYARTISKGKLPMDYAIELIRAVEKHHRKALEVAQAQLPQPTVVVELDGGTITTAYANVPVSVILLDEDTEGGDEDRIRQIFGTDSYVTEFRPCQVDAEKVADVVSEIEEGQQ